jgi:kynurenine formamidase
LEFFTSHPMFTPEAAQFLVDCGVKLVGVDFPSVDRPPFPIHIIFLGNGMVIVENLTNLAALKQDVFEFIALPLSFTGRDASPVRAVALEEE